jgi:hypothetical protein
MACTCSSYGAVTLAVVLLVLTLQALDLYTKDGHYGLLCDHRLEQHSYIRRTAHRGFISTGKPRVAISLLLSVAPNLLALETLLRSDIMKCAHIGIVAFSNDPEGAATKDFLRITAMSEFKHVPARLLTAANVTFDASRGWYDPRHMCPNLNNTGNLGIVLPRLRIMWDVLQHLDAPGVPPADSEAAAGTDGLPYDWLLEMHEDTYFPSSWFCNLIAQDNRKVGILMPFIRRQLPAGKKPTTSELDAFFKPLATDTSVSFISPIHPWLLKLDMVREVGYYNPVYSPWGWEDTEYYFYVCAITGWRCIANGNSWVLHLGSGGWGYACNRPDPQAYLEDVYGKASSQYYWCDAPRMVTGEMEVRKLQSPTVCEAFRRSVKENMYNSSIYLQSAVNRTWKDWRQYRASRSSLPSVQLW